MVRHSTRPASAPDREIPDPGALPADQRARRARIITAACAMMTTVDYAKIQVREVAESAGVSLGTLYRYFSSKDHLFACALADWAAPIEARLAERQRRARGGPAARARATFHAAARAFEDAPHAYGALMALAVTSDGYALAEFQDFARRQLDMFGGVIAEVPEPDRGDVVAVLSSVLSESLRGYTVGMYPMSGVYQRLDRAIRLIFRAPFEAAADPAPVTAPRQARPPA